MFGNIFSNWIGRVSNKFEREIEEAAQSIGLWILSGLLMAIAIGFATWLIYDELAPIYGPKRTLAGLSVCFGLASACSAFLARGRLKLVKNPTESPAERPTEGEDLKQESLSELASSMDDLASILGNAGLRKEALGLMAAKGALGDVKPLQLVGLAIMAGFIVGRGR